MLTYNKIDRQVHPSKTTMILTSEGGQKTHHEPSLGVEHISLNHNLFSGATSNQSSPRLHAPKQSFNLLKVTGAGGIAAMPVKSTVETTGLKSKSSPGKKSPQPAKPNQMQHEILSRVLHGQVPADTVSSDWLPDESFEVFSPFHFSSDPSERVLSLAADPLQLLMLKTLTQTGDQPEDVAEDADPGGDDREQCMLHEETKRDFELQAFLDGCESGFGPHDCADLDRTQNFLDVGSCIYDQGFLESCVSAESSLQASVAASVAEVSAKLEGLWMRFSSPPG